MLISATNCVWFSDPHDTQGITASRDLRAASFGIDVEIATSQPKTLVQLMRSGCSTLDLRNGRIELKEFLHMSDL